MAETKDIARMKELAGILDQAAEAYYNGPEEIMSNRDYDRLYEELETLERETGTVLAGSPTRKVGHEVLSELPKERHEQPMLSLNKTKSVEELRAWLGIPEGCSMQCCMMVGWPDKTSFPNIPTRPEPDIFWA